MESICANSGPSRVGKTFRGLNDPQLKALPFVDIGNVYDNFPPIPSG